MINLKDIIDEIIEDNTCINCGSIVDEDLRKWFGKGGGGGGGGSAPGGSGHGGSGGAGVVIIAYPT